MDDLDKIREKKLQDLMQRAAKGDQVQSPDRPFDVSDHDFDEQVSNHNLMLVDFWAPWCGPCRMVAPVLRQLAKDYSGRVAFGKLNTDENPQTSLKYRVMSIPTLIVFKRGKPVDMMVGAAPRHTIEAMIRKHLT